jgi:ABC-type transport system involved in Fe-S cluster assembly fused permease/ATPase subunit
VLFDVIPTFVDIVVALVVFAIRLDWTLAVVTFLVVLTYGAFRLSPPIFAYTLKVIQLSPASFLLVGGRGCGVL